MTLPDKIKALPLPECLDWPDGEYTADDLRALLDAAATLAAEHEARAQAMADLLNECRDFFTDCPSYDSADTNNLDTRCMDALRAWKESQ